MKRSIDPSAWRVPVWCWWVLGLTGFSVRAAFILRGNIAFSGDVTMVARWVQEIAHTGMTDGRPWSDYASLRIGLGLLFHHLTHGWIYSVPLASVFLNCVSSAILVHWVHQKVSRLTALFLALYLSLPPFCIAYFSTNLERRAETIFYGSLLILFSGTLSRSPRRLFVFSCVLGWAFWGEPFILFFALPILLMEFQSWREWRPRTLGILVALGSGTVLGSLLGANFNHSFAKVLLPGYVHWGLASLSGIGRNWELLTQAFPQYWSGNLPFGYLQASVLGLRSFPMEEGAYRGFLWGWWALLMALSIVGYVLFRPKGKWWKAPALLIGGPSLLLAFFFLFSAQTWDALSLRYLAFLVIGVGVGLGLCVEGVLRRHRTAGILLLLSVLGTQTFILGRGMTRTPTEFPALKVVRVLERMDLEVFWGNHWISDPAAFLSGERVRFLNYDLLLRGLIDPMELERPKVGLVRLEGLDRPDILSEVVRRLLTAGYRPRREWPMVDGWSVLEFHKDVPGAP